MKIKRSSSSTKTNVNRKVEALAKQMSVSQAVAAAAKATTIPPVAKKAEPDQPKKVGINSGQRTGLRVMAFQDATYRYNHMKVRPAPLGGPGLRTDEELAKEWCAEFPNSIAVGRGRITAEMVSAVRHHYNSGTAGHGGPGKADPQSVPYILNAKGERVPTSATRPRTRKVAPTAAPSPAPAAPVEKRKPVLVRPTVKPAATATATKGKAKTKKGRAA